MVLKGVGQTPEFVYGLGISSLQPPELENDEEDMPLRFVSVQLQIPVDTSKKVDIDIHAFLFEVDGTYVDCVFYKNPTLAGKSVRLLQQEQELLVDLRYVPKRCTFIVCTLAIYSGGTVSQLGDGTVKLAALVPKVGLGEGVEFPNLACGEMPPRQSDLYEWACLGLLPLKSRSSHGEECGMMLCLLAQHAGFWYFKPVLKPVTAFTPQGLIEPAQDFVTKHVAGRGAQHFGVELSTLLNAVRDGEYVEFDLSDSEVSDSHRGAGLYDGPGFNAGSWIGSQSGDKEGSGRSKAEGPGSRGSQHYRAGDNKGDGTWEDGAQKGKGMVSEEDSHWRAFFSGKSGRGTQGKSSGARSGSSNGGLQGPGRGHTGTRIIGNGKYGHDTEHEHEQDYDQESFNKNGRGIAEKSGDVRGRVANGKSKTWEDLGMEHPGKTGGSQRGSEGQKSKSMFGGSSSLDPLHRRRRLQWKSSDSPTGADNTPVNAESLFSSYPAEEGYAVREYYGARSSDGKYAGGASEEGVHFTNSWRDMVERRLSALEYAVDSIRSDLRTVAAAFSDGQRNSNLYVQELRDKFVELKSDVAADIEAALAGPLDAITERLEKLEANEAADAKQLAEQQQKLWAVDRMVMLSERNWHLLTQSISELRFQITGFEQRILKAPQTSATAAPSTDLEKGLPVSLRTPAELTKYISQEIPVQRATPASISVKNAKSTPEVKEQGGFAMKALEELNRMQHHAQAFGSCLRQLASGTAPDGLKGLSHIERKVLSFAGTPQVFSALHDLERAVDSINLEGSGISVRASSKRSQ